MAKSKTKTTEKKETIPASVQKYMPLVQGQIKAAMRSGKTDEDNLAQLQQEFNEYKKLQDLQSEYDSWKSKKTAATTKTETKSEPIKFMTAAERKAYKENSTIKKPGNYDESKSYANTYGANKSVTKRTGVNETINQLPTLKDYKEKVKNNSNEDLKQSLKDQEKREDIVAQAQAYLDPNKKLTKEEQKEASKLATEGLKTLRGKKLSKMTEYEKDAYNVFNDLKTKSSTLRATAIGAADKALDYGKTILKGVADTQSRKLAAENEAKQALGLNTGLNTSELQGIGQETRSNINQFDKMTEGTRQLAKNAAPIASPTIPILNKKVDINPYDVGRTATMLGAYMATNPAFDAVGNAANVGNVGKFVLNQAGQLAQDLALDTSQEVDKALADGRITPEEAQAIKTNIILNGGFNGVIGLGGAAAQGVGDLIANTQAKRAANQAFRANALEGLDRLQQVNNGSIFGYHNTNPEAVLRNADDVTAATNRQFSDLMAQYNNTFKDNSAMRDIYNPEDLNAALNRQLAEAIQNNPVLPEVKDPRLPISDNQILFDEVADLNKEMSNMWGNNKLPENKNIIPEMEQNVSKTEIKPKKNKVIMSEEMSDKIASDLMEMRDAIEPMRIAAEASNSEAAISKMQKLLDTMDDYEKALYYSEDLAEVNKAKKAVDAARQSFIREMKKIDPSYKGELTGTKVGNAEYRRTEGNLKQEEAEELANSFIESEKELGKSNYVQDAEPDSQIPFKGPNDNNTRLKMNLMQFTDENAVRHGSATGDDLWEQLKAGEAPEVKAPETKIPETPVENAPEGKKLSKLYSTLQNTDKLTDAEKETFKNKNGFYYNPDIEKKLGAEALEEVARDGSDKIYNDYMFNSTTTPYTGKDTHRMFTTAADYNRLSQEALKNGETGAAKLYAAKARNIMLEARFHATSGGQFNAAIGYYARTPQGYIDKANDVLVKRLQEFNKKNPKLADDIDEMANILSNQFKGIDIDGIMSGADEAAKETLRSQVLDVIGKVAKKGSPQTKNLFNNISPAELDNIITSKYEKDLARNLDMFAMGSFGVKPETVDKVLDIFTDAEKYNIKSKKYVELENEAFDLIMNDLNAGKGKSFGEKFDSWRYLSMLFNPLTWTKNIAGNLTNSGVTGVKNNISALMEEAAERVAKANGSEGIYGGRTKAVLNPTADKNLIEECAKDFDEFSYRDYINGGNKYINVEQELASAGDMFSNRNPVGKLLNKASNFNNDVMLGGMDTVAGKAKYKTSMAGFLKANGADSDIFKATDDKSLELLSQAREYALNAANEATFHTTRENASKISQFIREGKNSSDPVYNVSAHLLDFAVPFIKTPGNILRACAELSPANFFKVIAETGKWRKGEITTAKYLDDASKALTGTGLMVLGGALAENGLINVPTGDDEVDQFNNKKGLKANTIPALGSKNRRLSLANFIPGAMPILWGAMTWNAIKDAKEGNIDTAKDAFFNGISVMGDTALDLTMLSGISDIIDAVRYSEGKGDSLVKIGTQIAGNAASQLLPTLGRRLEQTIDDTSRSTYSGQKSKTIRSLDSTRKYLNTKIPMLQEAGEKLENSDNNTLAKLGDLMTNEPQVNGWGEEIQNQDLGLNVLGRAVHNTVDVFDTTNVDMNKRDQALKDIYDNGGKDKKVLQYGYVTTSDANVEDYRMTDKEWTQYQKDSGELRGKLLDTFMATDKYQNMSDADRSQIIDGMKSFAKFYSQYNLVGEKANMKLSSTNEKLMKAYNQNGAQGVINELVGDKEYTDAVKNTGFEKTSTTKKVYAESGETGLQELKSFQNYGKDNATDAYTRYTKTKQKIPSLTVDQYKSTVSKMDGLVDGKHNGQISQKEMLAYLNNGNYSQEEAEKLYREYGNDWTSTLYKNKKGLWAVKTK